MRGLLVLLAVCSFTAAMVPLERRALTDEEDGQPLPSPSTTTTPKPKEICAPQTACAWSIYKPNLKIIEFNITSTYCVCGEGTVCQINEDDSTVSAYIHHCRPPSDEELVES